MIRNRIYESVAKPVPTSGVAMPSAKRRRAHDLAAESSPIFFSSIRWPTHYSKT